MKTLIFLFTRWMRVMVLLILGLSSVACVSMQSSVKLKVISDKQLNLSDQKESLPVVLRVYELNDDGVFNQSHFESVWKQDREALADAWVSTHEYVVYPDAVERYVFKKNPQSRYLGFVGTFRTPEGSDWRKIVKVPVGSFSRSVRITLQGSRLNVE